MMNENFDPYETLMQLVEHAHQVNRQMEVIAETNQVLVDAIDTVNRRLETLERSMMLNDCTCNRKR